MQWQQIVTFSLRSNRSVHRSVVKQNSHEVKFHPRQPPTVKNCQCPIRDYISRMNRLNSLESPCASLSLRRFVGISRRVLAARFIRARSVVISLAVLLLLKTVVPGGTANKRAARRGIPCDIRSIRTNNSDSERRGRPYSPDSTHVVRLSSR